MKNAKKLLSILVLGTIICTHTYNVYQTCYAAEVVVAGGLASTGVALLGLGAIAGVGMELDNNRRFNELSDEEKERIENGLATNFEDVALQRGASIEHIKDWTTDLCNGVLDKGSECWGIFKDWIGNINLVEKENLANPNTPLGQLSASDSFPLSLSNNYYSGTIDFNQCYVGSKNTSLSSYLSNLNNTIASYYSYSVADTGNFYLSLYVVQKTDEGYRLNTFSTYVYGSVVEEHDKYNNGYIFRRSYSNVSSLNISDNVYGLAYQEDIPLSNGGVLSDLSQSESIFSTNTDYLEKLKGQDEDVIDVIDVTDIKNPIIESKPNSLANINWNRGTRRTNNNNDDDDNKMVTGLVPMDIWYEQIDDEQEQMQNAVVVYNNYIQEHPEEKDTYFISTTPVTNINNYFNTLPVVNIPTQGTIVNNNYEYNNYNNNNVTIYQEPYNAGIIPTFPDFRNKFPFCIPFDLYEFFVVFLAEKEAPKIEIPFPIIDNTNHQLTIEYITIDLTPYEYLSNVLRVMMFILFCVGLMLLTRQLIKG